MNSPLESNTPDRATVKPAAKNDFAAERGNTVSPQGASFGMMMRTNMVLSTLRSRRISLSTLQAVISLYLARGENLNLKDLAERLGVTTAAVTNVADGIEKLGFARRASCPGDRRHISMKLTPKGIAFAEWLTSMLSGTENPKSEMPGGSLAAF